MQNGPQNPLIFLHTIDEVSRATIKSVGGCFYGQPGCKCNATSLVACHTQFDIKIHHLLLTVVIKVSYFGTSAQGRRRKRQVDRFTTKGSKDSNTLLGLDDVDA